MKYRTVKIYCQCGTLLLKYKKIGKGRVLRCFLSRIIKSNLVMADSVALCPHCGSTIGHLTSGAKDDYLKLDQKNIKPVQV